MKSDISYIVKPDTHALALNFKTERVEDNGKQ